MKRRWVLLAGITLMGAGVAGGWSVGTEPGTEKPSIADLGWLAGRWTGEFPGGMPMEEIWSAPAGESMMGMFRLMSGGRTSMYEFLLIEADGDEIALRFKHIRRNYGTIDAEPLYLPAVEIGDKRVVFDNPKLKKPLRLVYELGGDDLLHVQIISGGEAEAASVVKLEMRKTRE